MVAFGPSIKFYYSKQPVEILLEREGDGIDNPDDWTMPVSSEYIPELNDLMRKIEDRFDSGNPLTQLERAALEVYGTIGHVECDNLLQFWNSGYDPLQAIESFRIVGEHEVADALYASRWLRTVVTRAVDAEYRYPMSATEESEYQRQEATVYALFIGIPTRLYNLLSCSTPKKTGPNNPMDRSGGSDAS
jgi:hypothetical protein